ncbi:MAG TPA: chorismate mutase [Sphingomonadaceae bacterium]|nr:chorismate mutase [Sphingomonadaceae bacterium]
MSHTNLRSTPPDLATLRREIDAVDDRLLDLIERRVGLSAQVAALKDCEAPHLLKLRPQREAEIVARLQRRARRAPPDMVAHLWRTLMSYGLQAQSPVRLVVHAAGDRQMLAEVVRARFGPAATLLWAASRHAALTAARETEAIAILDEGALAAGEDALRLFDTLPLAGGGRLHAIGRVAAEDIVQEAGQ